MDTLRQLADLQGREDNIVRKHAQLREELKDLDKLLEDVRIERRTLLDHSPLRPLISNHPPPRSPIYNLPVELLVMVFKHTVSGYKVGWQIALAEDFTPCKLVRVCHAWRKVALDTPYLWRFQFLNRPPTISKFLLLSKDLPLDIILLPTPGTHAMISSTKSYRWNSLFLVGTCQTYCLHIFASLDFKGRDFNRLSELDISCEDGFLAGRDYLRGPPHVLASSRFASLTTIKLSNICPTQLPTDTSFPSVESISLAFSPVLTPRASLVSGLCHFLARTPNVSELILRHGPPLSDNIISGSLPVSLSSLRRLEWEYAPPRDFWYLFCILDAPHLETFALTLDDASRRWRKEDGISPIEVSSLLTPSLAELRHLVVTCRDDKPEFIKLHIPALETLKICHDDLCLEPLIFPALGSMFRDPRLVKLSELELHGFVLEENFVQDTLVYMKFLHKITLDSCQGECHDVGRVFVMLTCRPRSARRGMRTLLQRFMLHEYREATEVDLPSSQPSRPQELQQVILQMS